MESTRRDEQIELAVGSLVILAVFAIAAGLWHTRSVMVPFVLAVFITAVVAPAMDFVVLRWRLPQSVGVLVAVVLVLAILLMLGLVMFALTQEIVTQAGKYTETVEGLVQRGLALAEKSNITIDQQRISRGLQEALPGVATQTVGTATGLVSNLAVILIFVIFLLAGRDPHLLRTGIYGQIESKTRRYIGTKLVLSAVTGILVWISLSLFDLEMAAVFGMLAFLLNFIPSVGSVIATLLPIPVALAQTLGAEPSMTWWGVFGVIAVPGAIQMVIGNGLEPKMMGKGLNVHPVTILLALAFWGLMWGVVGMVLAVPIVATLRIVLVRFDTTRPIGNLLAGQLPGRAAPAA